MNGPSVRAQVSAKKASGREASYCEARLFIRRVVMGDARGSRGRQEGCQEIYKERARVVIGELSPARVLLI